MHQLRPYQQEFKTNLSKAVKEHKHVIGCSPGGTGKTLVFSHIATDAAMRGRAVLILTHRKSIFGQNSLSSNGVELNPSTDKNLTINPGLIYVAMVQTIRNRPEWIEQFNAMLTPPLVIVDEAHLSDYSETLLALHNRITIGFTATPYYRTARHLPDFYKSLVDTNTISWFIENGYLCNYNHFERTKSDLETVLGKLKAGEYSAAGQSKYFHKKVIYDGLIEDLSHGRPYKKCMVFCANIENAELVAQQISNAGYLVTIGHSKRKDEAYQVNLFKDPTSGYNIFVSVAAYTVGFDHPPVDRLMLYRAFGSCSLYMQTLFRADRICEGKKEFDVYDYGGNKRHGFYYFDRPNDKLWQSTALRLSPKEQGVEPIKECPVCHALIGLMARTCPVCNAEQPVNEAENKQGELINITATYQAMMGRNIGTLSARELSIYAKLKNKAQFAIRIARSKRQTEISVYANAVKPPSYIPDPLRDANFLRDFAHYMDYKSSWCYQQYKIIEASKEAIEFTNFRLK